MAPISKSVLITGCSSGIGKATAFHLVEKGWRVYATARKLDTINDLKDAGCKIMPLDVTDELSMQKVVDTIVQNEGAVGVLINNAGYSQSGAIETLPINLMRQQFETNVFGLVRLTQMVLPGMRNQRWGRIFNIGSMGGRMTLPGGGAYHATKYAIEAISEVLRFEVKGFGIDVTLVEPGFIFTRFADNAISRIYTNDQEGIYQKFNQKVLEMTQRGYRDFLFTCMGGTPEVVARKISRTLESNHPPARIPVTFSAYLLMGLHTIVPDWFWDFGLQMFYFHPVKED
jgi:NADP-dependent 3-hydroxy acid dehydrogenase YdfG